MSDKKKCVYCEEQIESTDTMVLLSTISPMKKEDTFFHMTCFKRSYDEQINLKAREIITAMQKNAMGIFNSIKEVVGNFQGAESLGSMLGLNLKKEIKTPIKKEGKNNGRKKTIKKT